MTDIIFAVDSIPAIFAVTQEPFLVFASNALAILGLRAMYFLLADLMHRFVYLKLGLSLVLVWVGVKMIVSHGFVKIPTVISLGVVIAHPCGGGRSEPVGQPRQGCEDGWAGGGVRRTSRNGRCPMSRESVLAQWRRLPHPVRWIGVATVGTTLIVVGVDPSRSAGTRARPHRTRRRGARHGVRLGGDRPQPDEAHGLRRRGGCASRAGSPAWQNRRTPSGDGGP